MKIIAVVVTFNRLEILKETLDALTRQSRVPDSVVIINNASTDGTRTYLDGLASPVFEVIHSESNLGGAGGFKHGMQAAYARGADWTWCMDDDCIPNADALETLLEKLPGLQKFAPIGFLASRVEWTDGSLCEMNLPVAHRLWLEPHRIDASVSRIVGCSFVSVLVSREAIRETGFPVSEFFIWFDDAEYSRRISGRFASFLVGDSRVVHKTPTNLRPLDFSTLDRRSLWKFRYGVRNEMSFHVYGGSAAQALIFSIKTVRNLVRCRKYAYLPSVLMALVRGCLFNYRNYIEYPAERGA